MTFPRDGWRSARDLLVFGAPAVALLAGVGAEWLDFRALRVPFLVLAGLGVLATSYALAGTRPGVRPFLTAVAVGVLTWAAAEAVYYAIHVAGGGRFEFEAAGPQPSQALALVGVHALFLGAPTGAVAGLMLQGAGLLGLRGRAEQREAA